jgi:TolA-binding protein
MENSFSLKNIHKKPVSGIKHIARGGRPGRQKHRIFGHRALAAGAVLAVLTAAIMVPSCVRRRNNERYEAEKALFKARKMRQELVVVTMKPEFLEKTLDSYRSIVAEYRDFIGRVDGMEMIVVSAQMEIAELEFLGWKLRQARDDFREAYTLAQNIPEARANALYSAAFLSEEIGDPSTAIALYEQFFKEFLSPSMLSETASMNTRYLITPINLSELHRVRGNEKETERWLIEAETVYSTLMESGDDPALTKEMHFNILTTYLQRKLWRKAIDKIGRLRTIYTDSTADQASLLYLEATIYLDGLGDRRRALESIDSLNDKYPESQEAMNGLLLAGSMRFEAGEYDKAGGIYRRILERSSKDSPASVEASWMLAQSLEASGNWLDASLQYKTLYTNHPATHRGLEAPLRIAKNFSDKGESEVAGESYRRAIEHYEKITESQINETVKVMAEEYIVKAYAEQGEWNLAAEHLLELPGKYPDYARFDNNYLMAASIYEKELGNRDKAAAVLETCIKKYPGTGLAAEAEKQRNRIKGITK